MVVVIMLFVGIDAGADDGEEVSAVEGQQSTDRGGFDGVRDDRNDPALEAVINAILMDSEMRRTTVGIHVEDVSSGRVLYSREADRPMNPASNIKLLTAAAVLDLLGPEHTVSTTLYTDRRRDTTIQNLYLRGEGEAFLLFKDVLSWAGELRMQGITAIEGDLVVDDAIFEGAYMPPGFDLRPSDAAWRPDIGAVSVNFNAVTATISPGDTIGAAPTVRLDPPQNHVRVVNRARTVRGSLSRLSVTAEPQGNRTRITVTGTLGVNARSVSQRRRIDNPPAFAGAVMAEAMNMMGIEFDGEVRAGKTPKDSERLYVHNSQPLMNAISAMNKWSNNFIAEQLLRLLGVVNEEPSTWDLARSRAMESLRKNGMSQGAFTLYNGSGLYDGNLVSPRQFVSLLRRMRHHEYGPEFISSLAIAGVDGTLRHRLDRGLTNRNLRGKTGTLRDVSALSGYVETKSGRMVAFSIIFNDPPRAAWNYREQQDGIARAIAEFDG